MGLPTPYSFTDPLNPTPKPPPQKLEGPRGVWG